MIKRVRRHVLLAAASLVVIACAACSTGYGPTSSGNQFSCLVGGTAWYPSTLSSGSVDVVVNDYHDALQIIAYRYDSYNAETSIELDLNAPSTGHFELGSANRGYFTNSAMQSQDALFSTNGAFIGSVDIDRYDPNLREVSGSFSFDAENDVGNYVSIASGTFNLTY